MTEPLHFEVPGDPVGKGRPIAGKAFGSGFTTLRTPSKTKQYENLVGLSAHHAMQGRPMFEGALAVTLDIRVAIPASWSGKKKQRAADGLLWPTTKPDIDNVEKAIFDGLNGIAWRDDVQVVSVIKTKRYSLLPGVAVSIGAAHKLAMAPLHVEQQLEEA